MKNGEIVLQYQHADIMVLILRYCRKEKSGMKNGKHPPKKDYDDADGISEKQTEDEQSRKQAAKMSKSIFLLVLLLFVAVIFITDAVTALAGKTAGTIAMTILAAIIAIYLYREELKKWLRNKFKGK